MKERILTGKRGVGGRLEIEGEAGEGRGDRCRISVQLPEEIEIGVARRRHGDHMNTSVDSRKCQMAGGTVEGILIKCKSRSSHASL